MSAHGTSKRSYLVIALILLFCTYLRILALPADPQHAQGMTHDGSYLTIAAKNLLAGKSFVLDALWLVFSQPDRLPMPYHNSTPLYPTAIAAVARGFHLDVFRAGFLVAALSSAGLIVALTFLPKRYVNRIWPAFILAFLATLFPPVWEFSWVNPTDELWVAFVAALLCEAKNRAWPRWPGVSSVWLG
jgi:hypothetical protein